MRFVVFLDLFSTIVQPAALLYIIYLVYSAIDSTEIFPLMSIIMLGVIYGLQVIIFILKRQWAQIGWMVVARRWAWSDEIFARSWSILILPFL